MIGIRRSVAELLHLVIVEQRHFLRGGEFRRPRTVANCGAIVLRLKMRFGQSPPTTTSIDVLMWIEIRVFECGSREEFVAGKSGGNVRSGRHCCFFRIDRSLTRSLAGL
ncbi:hypothetical protein IGI04_027089 [Brassica rapa subsp. trilocularis]|uniref:Uncharacterized protein n=1 Tax=Brassica rapa subsp. trilocularis TaxID=1813537 RepID=A0ABQ7KY62_BRACM|nr:hypothetical protein IGI04_027089 [Brassica rapa subsp. trilocularis]